MSEAEHGGGSVPLERRPACDACRTRKTKCDRKSPCASCVTLKIQCRNTARSGEKRQRVLLSSKYEDAVQDVSRQLADVKEMLETLMLRQNDPQGGGSGDPPSVSHPLRIHQHHGHPPRSRYSEGRSTPEVGATSTPRSSIIDEQVPSLNNVQEGFAGDSSFLSQANQVKTALESTLATFGLVDVVEGQAKTAAPTKTPAVNPTTGQAPLSGPFDPAQHLDNGGDIPLPPIDIVLRILRLAKVEKQAFFVEVPIFEENEFTDMCRDVYFATEPVSVWKWICVNMGLFHLSYGLSDEDSARLGTNAEESARHRKLLKSNIDIAMQSLRLCSEPSIESCRAMAALVAFYIKEGHHTIAWRLISGAARAALDLGLHRMPSEATLDNLPMETALFWHIYAWDKALAMTSGSTPTIHHYDVTSGLDLFRTPRSGPKSVLYGALTEFTIVTGEIQESLFSASAQRASQQERNGHIERLSARLGTIRSDVESARRDKSTWEDKHLWGIVYLLEISIPSQLAVIHRLLPPKAPQVHPLQCSEECVSESRQALLVLVSIGESRMPAHPDSWVRMMNTVLAVVPLVPFLVLAGNTIATRCVEDLDLLSRFMALLDPVVNMSPAIRKIHDACAPFNRIAHLIAGNVAGAVPPAPPLPHALPPSTIPTTYEIPSADFSLPMGQQDWDSVMTGFESELGDYDSRMLTNIIEPYFSNAGW